MRQRWTYRARDTIRKNDFMKMSMKRHRRARVLLRCQFDHFIQSISMINKFKHKAELWSREHWTMWHFIPYSNRHPNVSWWCVVRMHVNQQCKCIPTKSEWVWCTGERWVHVYVEFYRKRMRNVRVPPLFAIDAVSQFVFLVAEWWHLESPRHVNG